AWQRGAPVYGELVYPHLYSGVDLVYDGSSGRLKSEFRVAAGADPNCIRMQYSGVEGVKIDRDGGLVLRTRRGTLREQAPELFQRIGGKKAPVSGSFRILADGSVGFQVGDYDRDRELIIDPVIACSTYVGGSGMDSITGVAVDAAGNVYVAGWTDSGDLPLRNAVWPRSGNVDAFVAKWSNKGATLEYCTYLGGAGDDRAFGIAVDGSGSAYVTGWTTSRNFPILWPLQAGLAGTKDAFVTRLNASGQLVYSTYLGGTGTETGNAIAVDSAGNATVVGDTDSVNFPRQNAFQSSKRGQGDVFVTRLNAPGNTLLFSTYLGGSGDDHGKSVALDSSGYVYITGSTASLDFPVLNAFRSASGGNQDAFITKLSGSGNAIAYSTYLGGSGGTSSYPETGAGITVDASGNAFVVKVNAFGNALLYSTYLGGSSLDYGLGIAVDAQGNAWVAGYTASPDFPTANGSQPTQGGGYDAFAAKLDATGKTLLEGTYLGGGDSDSANAVALDSSGSVYVAGQTLSVNFPVLTPTQTTGGGSQDGFLTRMTGSPMYAGSLEEATCSSISGWAWDKNNPAATVSVDILDGSTLVATVAASVFRQDLLTAGYGDGYHGFGYSTPNLLKDGRTHSVRV